MGGRRRPSRIASPTWETQWRGNKRERRLSNFSLISRIVKEKKPWKNKNTSSVFLLFRVFVCFLCATLSLARNKETRTKEQNRVGEKRQIIKKSKAKSNCLKNKKETGIYTKQKRL